MKPMGCVPFVRLRLPLLAALFAAGTVHALEVPPGATTETHEISPHLTARLLVDAAPVGEPGRVGVLFDLEPEWHLYWKNVRIICYWHTVSVKVVW